MRQFNIILICIGLVATTATKAYAHENRDSLVTESRFIKNTFIQTGAGPSSTALTSGKFNGRLNFTFDAAVGKWLAPNVGVRLGYQGFNYTDWESGSLVLPGANKTLGSFNGEDAYCVRMDYSYVHGDLLWNPLNQFAGYRNDRFFDFMPYAHIGYEFVYNGFAGPKLLKYDPAAGVGVFGKFKLSRHMSAFIDARATMLVRHTNIIGSPSYRISSTFGINYDITEPTWQKIGSNDHAGYGFTKFIDNTFIGIGGGLGSYIVPHEKAGWNGIARPIGNFYIGKWVTPSIGVRLGFIGGEMSYWAGKQEFGQLRYTPGFYAGREMLKADFTLYNVHADLLWNASNTFSVYDRSKIWDLVPYISFNAGYQASPDNGKMARRDFFGGLGLLTNLKVSNHVGINLDLKADLFNDRPYGMNNRYRAFLVEAMLGTSYTFGDPGWNYYRPAVHSHRPVKEKPNEEGFILNNGFFDNSFVSLHAGVNVLFTSQMTGSTGRVSPSMEASFGKMITTGFGFRIGVQGSEISQYGVNPIQGVGVYQRNNGKNVLTAGYLYPHLDAMLDMNSIFGEFKPDRFYRAIFYPHLGYIGIFSQDNSSTRAIVQDVGYGAGLLNKFRISERVDIDLDLRWTGTQAVIDQAANFTHILTTDLGLSYNLGTLSWIHSTERKYDESYRTKVGKKNLAGYIISKSLLDNTFISFMAGVNMLSDASLGYGYNARPTVALDIDMGKWIIPHLGLRIGYQGRNISEWGNNPKDKTYASEGTFKGQTLNRESVGYGYYHLDVMTNLMNDIAGFKAERVYTISPYASFGLVNLRASDGSNISCHPGGGGGLLNTFNISRVFALNLDLRATGIFGDIVDKSSNGSAAVLSALAGVSYTFGRPGWAATVQKLPEQSAEYIAEQNTRKWAISTNLLGYVDLGTINVEAQYALSRHFTLDMKAKSNAWAFKKKDGTELMDKKSLANVGVRYWPWYMYSGLWFKSGLQVADYTINGIFKNRSAERGDCYGLECAGGYSIIICPWLNIDLGLGIWGGYRDTRRYKTPQLDNIGMHNGEAFVGLSDASVSLMFVF